MCYEVHGCTFKYVDVHNCTHVALCTTVCVPSRISVDGCDKCNLLTSATCRASLNITGMSDVLLKAEMQKQ